MPSCFHNRNGTGHDAGIMATLDFKYGLLMGLDIHRMLRLIDGSRRLYDNTEQEGMPVVKASQDTAIAVCSS